MKGSSFGVHVNEIHCTIKKACRAYAQQLLLHVSGVEVTTAELAFYVRRSLNLWSILASLQRTSSYSYGSRISRTRLSGSYL